MMTKYLNPLLTIFVLVFYFSMRSCFDLHVMVSVSIFTRAPKLVVTASQKPKTH